MRSFLLFLLCLQVGFLVAQERPEPRDHFAMTFDASRGRLVLFGGNGNNSSGYLSDVWEYDGSIWLKVNDNEMTPRSSHVMVFIPDLNKSLLLGGVSKEGEYLMNMGFWDGNKWLSVAEGPSPRYSPAIAYDESRKTIVLFSGAGRGEDLMWEFNSGTWKAIELNDVRPSERVRSQMVYDYKRKKVVLFGGYAGGMSVDDMWEWDGSNWTLVSEAGPSARDMTSGAFDMKNKKVMLFGGRNGDREKLGDLWAWDGVSWTKIH